jgi:hypothetical protein
MLWRDRPTAPATSSALLPVEFAFRIGFALPAGPSRLFARIAE